MTTPLPRIVAILTVAASALLVSACSDDPASMGDLAGAGDLGADPCAGAWPAPPVDALSAPPPLPATSPGSPITTSVDSTGTVCPSRARIFRMTPARGAGISTFALSVRTSTIG